MEKTRKLKLGWLFPYSSIYPDLRENLEQGLELAMQQAGSPVKIEAYPVFVQTGAIKDTEDAVKKLLLYDKTDLVMGVASSKVVPALVPLLESRKTPMILLNLGADIPNRQLSSDYLFYNSLHLWKSQWVMGKWAQRRYGGEPSINMSIYESGYGLHECFKTGTAVSGAETVKMNIIRNISSTPDTAPLIQYIREQAPSHAHILLSGKEGQQFLQLFRDENLGSTVELTVNPFMAEDGLLKDLPPGLDLYNATTWSSGLDSVANRSFVEGYGNAYGMPPSAFSLLAYEAGLALVTALEKMPEKIVPHALSQALGDCTVSGPRGEIRISTRPLQTNLPVYIRKPVQSTMTAQPLNCILATEPGIEWDDPSFNAPQSYLTGWQNPYLCV
jgi:branched-chain amino acid transport system substrate-binding protein